MNKEESPDMAAAGRLFRRLLKEYEDKQVTEQTRVMSEIKQYWKDFYSSKYAVPVRTATPEEMARW